MHVKTARHHYIPIRVGKNLTMTGTAEEVEQRNSPTAGRNTEGTATLKNRLAVSYKDKHMARQSHSGIFTLD